MAVRVAERHGKRGRRLGRERRGSALAIGRPRGRDLAHTRARLLALSPASTLRRGYAIVQHPNDGVVRSAAEVDPGETLTVRFAADQLTVRADG